jgi:hypothetical protein
MIIVYLFGFTIALPENSPFKSFGYVSKSSANESSLVNDLTLEKSINLAASPHTNSLLFMEEPDESMPHNLTPLIIKGITFVLIFIPPAFPHAATIPPGFVCANIFVKAAPPTVSTTPSQTPFSKSLLSPSQSFCL